MLQEESGGREGWREEGLEEIASMEEADGGGKYCEK